MQPDHGHQVTVVLLVWSLNDLHILFGTCCQLYNEYCLKEVEIEREVFKMYLKMSMRHENV